MAQVQDGAETASMLACEVRSRSRLSQRRLGELAGTSGPTIAAYERGTKEPRLSTLERLAASTGMRIEARLVSTDPGDARRRRRRRRSLAIAAATAAAVTRDFPAARRIAQSNLRRMAEVVGDNAAERWIEAWRRVIDEGPDAVQRALLDEGEQGHDMRQMSPFAGVLGQDERTAALAVVDVLDRP